MELLLYWFMFPVAILISTFAMLSGIGGAALFTPLFILVFPLLSAITGNEYGLSPVEAIATALLTETFGFSSGLYGYWRRGLIDWSTCRILLIAAIPSGILGSALSHLMPEQALRTVYGFLMLGLAFILLRRPGKEELQAITTKALAREYAGEGRKTRVVTRDGGVYVYDVCNRKPGIVITSLGALITGMISVGIGEVEMPQLVKRCRVPVPVAAATSVVIVAATVMTASLAHVVQLVEAGGTEAVPWNLLAMTVPGVILGGQLGPRLQGRVSSGIMEALIAALFAVIGVAMLIVAGK